MTQNPNSLSNLKPFTKGDKRINRKGRPKSFDALRKLAQQVASEEALEGVTVIEDLLRKMARSKNPADRKLFLEYTYGKPKEEIETDDNKPLVVRIVKASQAQNDDSE